MWEALLDALIDSLKIIPIMFLIYILIEIIEVKCAKNFKNYKFLNNGYSPLIASAIGIIPQCGFSVVATDLYAKKRISIASLLAVYIATSDEAIPIMLSNSGESAKLLIPLLLVKFVFAVLVGYSVLIIMNIISKRKLARAIQPKEKEIRIIEEESHLEHTKLDEEGHFKKDNSLDVGCCGHAIEKEEKTFLKFIWHPIKHVLKIFFFILLVNIIFSLLIYWVGEENIAKILLVDSIFQPFIVGLIGLIPNCASSVIITELYILGGISFGSAVAGLSVNAGIALLVLIKENKNKKENAIIISSLYLLSTILGFIISLIV